MNLRLDLHDLSNITARAEALAAETSPETAEILINALRNEHNMFGAELGRESIEEVVDHFITQYPRLAPFRWSLTEAVTQGVRHGAAETLQREMRDMAREHLVNAARWTLRPVITSSKDYTFKVIFSALRDHGARTPWRASSNTCEFDSLAAAREFAADRLGQLVGSVFPETYDDTIKATSITSYDVEIIHISGATVMVLESEEVAPESALAAVPDVSEDLPDPEEVKITELLDQVASPEEARRLVEALTERHRLEGQQ